MRIEDVRVWALRNPDAESWPGADRNGLPPEPEALTVVEITTADGLSGYGTVGGFATGSAEIIRRHFASLLIGSEAAGIEELWERLYATLLRAGTRGTGVMALSGVDIALWDLLGKSLQQPVYRLLGGATRTEVPVYLSQLRNRRGLEALAAAAARSVEEGFRAVKYFFSLGPAQGLNGMRREIEAVGAIRAALGPDVELMVDAHFKWDLPYAQRMLQRLVEFDLTWLENPLPLDDRAGYERLARMEAIPLAAGESERTRFPFVDLINAGVHYLQPDLNRVGGLTEVLRICGLAASHSRPVCPHQGWLHTWHLILARACCPIGEYFPRLDPLPGNSLIWTVLEGEPETRNGQVAVPDRPGFGWTLNRVELERRALA